MSEVLSVEDFIEEYQPITEDLSQFGVKQDEISFSQDYPLGVIGPIEFSDLMETDGFQDRLYQYLKDKDLLDVSSDSAEEFPLLNHIWTLVAYEGEDDDSTDEEDLSDEEEPTYYDEDSDDSDDEEVIEEDDSDEEDSTDSPPEWIISPKIEYMPYGFIITSKPKEEIVVEFT